MQLLDTTKAAQFTLRKVDKVFGDQMIFPAWARVEQATARTLSCNIMMQGRQQQQQQHKSRKNICNTMGASNIMGASNSIDTSNSMSASNKGKSIDITNSRFIIISKGASNSREASSEDVENIALKITVDLNGRRGAMVEYSVGYLKVKVLRLTSA
jgi:hypothetical protein